MYACFKIEIDLETGVKPNEYWIKKDGAGDDFTINVWLFRLSI